MNAAFAADEWTAAESTARLDYATSSVPRVHLQPDAEAIEPLPPAPFDLVPQPAREPWRIPWAFLFSFAFTLTAVAIACR